MKTFYQAITMGIITVILGLIFYNIFITSDINKPKNKSYILESSLFFTGITIRYLLEIPIVQEYLHED
jgi:hypothetical protein